MIKKRGEGATKITKIATTVTINHQRLAIASL